MFGRVLFVYWCVKFAVQFFHHANNDYYHCHFSTENQVELRKLAGDSRYENPKMSKLESVLLNQFGPTVQSRGILFCKTRKSTHCLDDWVCTNKALQEAGVKAAILTGAGNGISYMTQVC